MNWDWSSEEAATGLQWFMRHAAFFDFDGKAPIFLARAPGRLDLMGGIADYSGSLVLQLPLKVATWVAVQPHDQRTVTIQSDGIQDLGVKQRAFFQLGTLVPDRPLEYGDARALFAREPERTWSAYLARVLFEPDPEPAWAAYVAGALIVLHRELGQPLRKGVRILIGSDVPVGKGISSSAALEVAALEALAAMMNVQIGERELALLAQKVENHVVGAPCGVMDQMTAACGRPFHLMELLCQPAELRGHLAIPAGLEVFGVDSGIRHAVSGADYGSVRTAAFMGYRIIAAKLGLPATSIRGRVEIEDRQFGGYLANVSPALWRERFESAVPERMPGKEFLARYGGSTDDATTVDPERVYAVRTCTAHPIFEHERVTTFRSLLAAGAATEAARVQLGELMYQSHASYSRCGLGSDGTDLLVDMVRAAGPAAGFYGAKITGGGSGGTVAVLAAAGKRAALEQIVDRYQQKTERAAQIFAGSSPGARPFGVRRLPD